MILGVTYCLQKIDYPGGGAVDRRMTSSGGAQSAVQVLLAGQIPDHKVHRQAAHLFHRLGNNGERRIGYSGENRIVKADDRTVLRNARPSSRIA